MAIRTNFFPGRLARIGSILFLFATLLLTGSDRTSEIKVLELKGPPAVIVMADGSTPPIRVGEQLPLGATVKTPADSTLKLLFANGAIVVLQPRSQLRLALFASQDSIASRKSATDRTPESAKSDTNIDLRSGTILIDVPTLKKESKFEVTTPLGISGVRGTRFYVSVQKDRAAVGVAEGLVVATSLLGESVQVRPNQAIILTTKGLAPATGNEVQYIQSLDSAFGSPHRPGPLPSKSAPKSKASYKDSE